MSTNRYHPNVLLGTHSFKSENCHIAATSNLIFLHHVQHSCIQHIFHCMFVKSMINFYQMVSHRGLSGQLADHLLVLVLVTRSGSAGVHVYPDVTVEGLSSRPVIHVRQ